MAEGLPLPRGQKNPAVEIRFQANLPRRSESSCSKAASFKSSGRPFASNAAILRPRGVVGFQTVDDWRESFSSTASKMKRLRPLPAAGIFSAVLAGIFKLMVKVLVILIGNTTPGFVCQISPLLGGGLL